MRRLKKHRDDEIFAHHLQDLMPAPAEQAKIDALEAQRQVKWEEIAAEFAQQLGYAPPSKLNDADRKVLCGGVEALVDNWEERFIASATPPQIDTVLKRLLQDHLDICEQILDLRDAPIARAFD